MNSSFNNRIDAQREILNIINRKDWHEELYGLSQGALDRWQKNNPKLNPNVINILKSIGEILFFLGTKSQEQITDDYAKLCFDIEQLKNELIIALRS